MTNPIETHLDHAPGHWDLAQREGTLFIRQHFPACGATTNTPGLQPFPFHRLVYSGLVCDRSTQHHPTPPHMQRHEKIVCLGSKTQALGPDSQGGVHLCTYLLHNLDNLLFLKSSLLVAMVLTYSEISNGTYYLVLTMVLIQS